MSNKEKKIKLQPAGYLQLLYSRTGIKWAQWMGRQSLRLGRRGVMIAFGLYTGISGVYCLLLILSGGTLIIAAPAIKPARIITIRAPNDPGFSKILSETLQPQYLKALRTYRANPGAYRGGGQEPDSLFKAWAYRTDSLIKRSPFKKFKMKKDEK